MAGRKGHERWIAARSPSGGPGSVLYTPRQGAGHWTYGHALLVEDHKLSHITVEATHRRTGFFGTASALRSLFCAPSRPAPRSQSSCVSLPPGVSSEGVSHPLFSNRPFFVIHHSGYLVLSVLYSLFLDCCPTYKCLCDSGLLSCRVNCKLLSTFPASGCR